MKEGTEGKIFSGSSFSHNFPCVPQQVSLVRESCTSISLLIKSPEGRDVMPLSSVPSGADTLHFLNWVICPPVCFIAREGDSVELGDGESYICGNERRFLLPSQCFSEHGGGSPGVGTSSPSLFQTLQPAGPQMCSFSSTSWGSCIYLIFFFLIKHPTIKLRQCKCWVLHMNNTGQWLIPIKVRNFWGHGLKTDPWT